MIILSLLNSTADKSSSLSLGLFSSSLLRDIIVSHFKVSILSLPAMKPIWELRMESGALGWLLALGHLPGLFMWSQHWCVSSHKDPDSRPRGRRWSEIITDSTTGATNLEAPKRTTWLQLRSRWPLTLCPALLFSVGEELQGAMVSLKPGFNLVLWVTTLSHPARGFRKPFEYC
jgi:hypothetical protein